MFQNFIDQLKNSLSKGVPGEDTQFLMAPLNRDRIKELSQKNYTPRKSAVLILLFPIENAIYTVLIERPEYEGVHSGQIAFPGGKFEDTDVDLKQTALREAFEEVGVMAESVEVIGRLTDVYIPPSNFLVTPFIGYTNKLPNFIRDAREVKKIITVNLIGLTDPKLKGIKTIENSNGYKIKTPYYEIEGFTVWGATAMMISELNALVESIFS